MVLEIPHVGLSFVDNVIVFWFLECSKTQEISIQFELLCAFPNAETCSRCDVHRELA